MSETKLLPQEELRDTVEALLLLFSDGLYVKDIKKNFDNENIEIKMILDSLVDDYLERDGGIVIQETGGLYKFASKSTVYENLQLYLKEKKKDTLSRAMLETLAIITYKQPITLFEVEEVRGVNSRSIVTALASKNLIKGVGHKEAPGRPTIYATTKDFLKYFGISSLEELPSPREIKEINIEDL